MRLYRIRGRQAHYGLAVDDEGLFETLRESFGECDLSAEIGLDPVFVCRVPDDLSYKERWDLLAVLENIGVTYTEQAEARALAAAEEDAAIAEEGETA